MIAVAACCCALAVLVLWPAAPTYRLASISPRTVQVAVGFGPAARRRSAARRKAALDFLGSLGAELAAGTPASRALIAAAHHTESNVCPGAVAAAHAGGDIAAALDHDASAQRLAMLHWAAACWRVGESSGAGLSASIDRLLRSARANEEITVQLEAQLAAPRATARMLAMLPLIGVAMGMLLGANPIAWLTTTGPGLLCLLAGLAFTFAGWVWTGRIAAAVMRLM